MRHKIITVICVVALVVVGVFVYQSAKSGAAHRAVVSAKAAAAVYYKQKVQAQVVAAEKQRLATQCAAQTKFYNSLPATQQAKVAKPQCNLAPIE